MTSSFGLSSTALAMCDLQILCEKGSKVDNSLRVCLANTNRAKKHLLNILPSHLVGYSLLELKEFIGRMLFMLRMDNIIAIENKKPAKDLIMNLKGIQVSLNSVEDIYNNLISKEQQDNSYNNVKDNITKLIAYLEKEFTIGTNDSNKKEYSNSYFYNNHILSTEEGLIDASEVTTAIEDENIVATLINTINSTTKIKELDKVTLLLKWTLNYLSNIKDTTKDGTDKAKNTFKILIGKLQSTLKYFQVLCNSDKITDKDEQAILTQLPTQIQTIIDELEFIKSKYNSCRGKIISKHNLKSAKDIYDGLTIVVAEIKSNLEIITTNISKVIESTTQSSNTISVLDTTFTQLNLLLSQFTVENINTRFAYTGIWQFNQMQYAILNISLSNLLKAYYYLTVKSIEYNSTSTSGLNSIETILLGRDLKSRSNLLTDMRDKTMYDMNIALNCPHTLEVKKSYLQSITKVIKVYTQKLHLLNSLQSNDKEDVGIGTNSSNPIEDLQVALFAYMQFKSRLKEEDLAIYLRYGLIELNDLTINEADNLKNTAQMAMYYKTTDNVLKSSSIEKSIQTALNSLRETYKIIEGQIFYYTYCINSEISPKDLARQLLA